MPEGDTIWRTARTLEAALAGATVSGFSSTLPAVTAAASRQRLVGRTIEAVEAHGKHLLIRFAGGAALHTHLGMKGSWRLRRVGSAHRPSRAHPRVRIETERAIAECFGAPVVEVLTARQRAAHPALARLGPDLLDEAFDPRAARARLRARADLAIGVALMDQTALAGIGNVYKSEALFLAGVAPTARVGELDDADLARLIALARELMTRNIGPGARGPRRTTAALSPERVWVYRRSGRPCRRCGAGIQRLVQGDQARSTWFCPVCQSRAAAGLSSGVRIPATVPPSTPRDRAAAPLRRAWGWACPPDPDLDPVLSRKSRLLAGFLLVAIAVFSLVDILYVATLSGYVPPWYGYVLLLGAWALNRCGRYRAAATVTLAMFPLVIFALVIAGAAAEPQITLSYLVLGILLASILLSWRGVAVFTVVSLGGLALMPLLAPATVPSLSALIGPFSVTALGAGLSLVFMHYRDQLERDRGGELRALIRELEVKNTELERFTYTVAHDLKSPLVTIRGFLSYLEGHAAAGRLDAHRADVARIVAASDRMQRLLNELLRLSRVGRVVSPPENVALEAVAREVGELASDRLAEKGITLEIAEGLPTVRADRLRVVELVQNLVDNAARFTGDSPTPRISVGWRDEPEGPVVFVRDTGIGIAPAHHETVFGLFDKLDPRTEGTGVGLALARRIVEVHGGRIWIESEGLGHGTTVCFTLPGSPATGS